MGLTRRTGGFPTMELSAGLIRKLSSYFIRLPANLSARVYNDQDFTIPDGGGVLAYTAVEFTAERWDTGTNNTYANGFWDVANSTRLTAVTHGFYVVSAHAAFEPDAVGWRGLQIQLNGTEPIATLTIPAVTIATEVTLLTVATVVLLNEGDYVEMLAAQTSGGNLDLGSDYWSDCDFTIARVP